LNSVTGLWLWGSLVFKGQWCKWRIRHPVTECNILERLKSHTILCDTDITFFSLSVEFSSPLPDIVITWWKEKGKQFVPKTAKSTVEPVTLPGCQVSGASSHNDCSQ
jgi:hypothetical protein